MYFNSVFLYVKRQEGKVKQRRTFKGKEREKQKRCRFLHRGKRENRGKISYI